MPSTGQHIFSQRRSSCGLEMPAPGTSWHFHPEIAWPALRAPFFFETIYLVLSFRRWASTVSSRKRRRKSGGKQNSLAQRSGSKSARDDRQVWWFTGSTSRRCTPIGCLRVRLKFAFARSAEVSQRAARSKLFAARPTHDYLVVLGKCCTLLM